MHHDSYPIVRVNSVPGYPAAVEQDELGDLQRLINADIYDESSRTAAGFAANPPPTPAPGKRISQRKETTNSETALEGPRKEPRKSVASAKAKAAEESRRMAEAEKADKAAKEAKKKEEAAIEATKRAEAKEAERVAKEAKKAEEAKKTAAKEAERQARKADEKRKAAEREAERVAAGIAARELFLRAEMEAREARLLDKTQAAAAHTAKEAEKRTQQEVEEARRITAYQKEQERAKRKADEAKKKIADLEAANKKVRREAEKANLAAAEALKEAEKARNEADNLRSAGLASLSLGSEFGWRPYRSTKDSREEQAQWSAQSDDGAYEESTPHDEHIEAPQGSGKVAQSIKMLADKVRQAHPDYADWPDEYLAAQPLDVLIKAKAAAATQEIGKSGKKIESKLHTNFAKAKANPFMVKGGPDNRSDILHDSRFLPGAAAPGKQLWLQARRVWGQHGVDAVCNYDLTLVGMAGCVTAKGLDALHNPGNGEISVKMFTVSNVTSSRTGVRAVFATGEDSFETFDTWKELNDINELREAFRRLMRVAQMVRPWDYSFMCLEGWLTSTFWLNEELKGFKRAALLGDFIDHVMEINASNWVQELPFMDTHQIQTQWGAWWGSRRSITPKEQSTAKGKHSQESKAQKGNSRGGGRGGGKGGAGASGRGGKRHDGQWGTPKILPPFDKEPTETTTCPFYNREMGCKNDTMNCVQWRGGKLTRMFHRCNRVIKGANGQNALCKEPHPQYEH